MGTTAKCHQNRKKSTLSPICSGKRRQNATKTERNQAKLAFLAQVVTRVHAKCHQNRKKSRKIRILEQNGKENGMFDKFGEMGSWKELNELAENLKAEGDLEGLKTMAAENGIYADFVDLFIEGTLPMLCDEYSAANGKLDIECAELKPQGLMEDWTEYIRGLCFEEPAMAAAVRKKGKSLKGCMAKLLRYSFENRVPVDKDIVKEAKINAGRVDFGVCGMKDAKRMIREYYLEGAE